MKFNDLRLKTKEGGIFSFEDIFKWFPQASRQTVKNQLRQWIKKGYFLRLRKNLYFLKETQLKDEFVLANRLYEPSYVSLESALNYYGIIPDVPLAVTSITSKKTQKFKNQFGLFIYRTIKPELFFGWDEVVTENGGSYKIARSEKAFFDFLWLNQHIFGKNFPQEERFSFDRDFNWGKFYQIAQLIKKPKFTSLVRKLKHD